MFVDLFIYFIFALFFEAKLEGFIWGVFCFVVLFYFVLTSDILTDLSTSLEGPRE